MTDAITIELPELTGPQFAIDEALERCLMVEGSPRAAKSWGVCIAKIWLRALRHPGIRIIYARYVDGGLATLKEIWSAVGVFFPAYLHPRWNAAEQSWDFDNAPADAPPAPEGQHYGSRVYLTSLKSADVNNVHSKYKGKTPATIVVEEANEVPLVNYRGLKERLSQSRTPWGTPYDYPLQIVLVTNGIDEDHYLATEFPTSNTKPGHRHVRADLYSNAHNLGPAVMSGYEMDYPPGHPLRRTVIEGKRGPSLTGTPVYRGSFRRSHHVVPIVPFTPGYALLEGWDFGQEKPAVTWWQYLAHIAALRCVGAVKGVDLVLELFAPRVLAIRRRLFPHATELRIWCDPTGLTGNHGLQYTAVVLLHQLGIPANIAKDPDSNRDGNDLEVRDKAIQVIAGYQNRVCMDGTPAFLMPASCIELKRDEYDPAVIVEHPSSVFVDAFEAGYVWADKAASDAHPNIRSPKKRTRYDDLMNASEYVVIGEGIPLAPTVSQIQQAAARYQTAPERQQLQAVLTARRAQREEQRDTHPVDGRAARIPMGGRRRRSFY